MSNCKHKRTILMIWPDDGTAELCLGCLMTRHDSDFGLTEWQDHSYKSRADWYLEAAALQLSIDKIIKAF